MGRGLLFGAVMCAILLAAATTRSDVATPALPQPSTPAEPPAPVGPTGSLHKDPFAPYDVGPPESVWPYAALTPEEKAVVDRGRAETNWGQIHDAYGTAALERSQQARAEAAEHDLGVVNLNAEGVVP